MLSLELLKVASQNFPCCATEQHLFLHDLVAWFRLNSFDLQLLHGFIATKNTADWVFNTGESEKAISAGPDKIG